MTYGGFSHGSAAAQTEGALRERRPFKRSGYNLTAEQGHRMFGLGMLPKEWEAVYRADEPTYTVFSYDTPIAWVTRHGTVRIPDVKYSPTTTQHQHTCWAFLADLGKRVETREVARRAEAIIEARAQDARTGADGEWRNPDVRRAFVRTLKAITVHIDGPGQISTVAPANTHGRDWAYVGGEALAKAAVVRGPYGATVALVHRADDHTYRLTIAPTTGGAAT